MDTTRRDFLAIAAAGVAATALGTEAAAEPPQPPAPPVPDSPPVWGTTAVGPEVNAATFAEAEKLVQVTLRPAERQLAASSWQKTMAGLLERRVGPRRLALDERDVPGSRWDPAEAAGVAVPRRNRFVRRQGALPPLPARDEDIAFAPLTSLSRWLAARQLTSERLTRIYLERLERFQPRLLCTITLAPERALDEARRADAEIAAGHHRGPLHGVPWGAKDLIDTAGLATTYGAEPFRARVPTADAVVVSRLRAAGAVLVAKLSMGALALNDVWFGGQTRNPWNLDEGSSGSSAGAGAATAAGLVGFSLGSETLGSIVSPSSRCGVVGLRPTFGRVPRTGSMALCWSLDKLGPMCRGVEDTALVLRALAGPDAGDPSSVAAGLDYDGNAPVRGLRVGHVPAWTREAGQAKATPAGQLDLAALEHLVGAKMVPVEVALPDWPYDSLAPILFAESAAAFEELTLSHGVDQLAEQRVDAWPNTFRQSRFLSAVDLVQADRLRRKVARAMAEVFARVDVLLTPSFSPLLTIGNFTGHPSLTVRTGFVEVAEARDDWAPDPAHPPRRFQPPRRVPHATTLVGRLFDEGTLVRVGMALEHAASVAEERPAGFV